MSKDCQTYSFVSFAANGIASVVLVIVGLSAYFGPTSSLSYPIVGIVFWSVAGYAFVQAIIHLFVLTTRNR